MQRTFALWGTTEEVAANPEMSIIENALYLPRTGDVPHRIVARSDAAGSIIEGMAIPSRAEPDPSDRAVYFLLEGLVAHYGHFIVDCMSRFWPLVAWQDVPVRIVCASQHDRACWKQHTHLSEILAGLGLDSDDLVTFDRPVVLPRAMAAQPSFHSLERVHTIFGELCRKIGRRYWSDDEVDSNPRPAYLSKSRLTTGVQHLENEAELVAELERRGVDILFPETMTFAEQVREFARRRVLMGPVGSAFHTSAFSAPGRRLIGLTSSPQINSNYGLFDRVSACRGTYYFVPGTEFGTKDGFGFSWKIPDPQLIAAQLVARADNIDRIELYDREIEAAEGRKARTLTARLRRLLHAVPAPWNRARRPPRGGHDAR